MVSKVQHQVLVAFIRCLQDVKIEIYRFVINIGTCIDCVLYHAHPGSPSAPQNLTTGTISATAVVLSWSPPQDSGGMGTVFYTVYYQALISGSLRMTWGTVTTTSVTVTNLLPATEYRMTVVAQNGLPGDERNRSTIIDVTTLSKLRWSKFQCEVLFLPTCIIHPSNCVPLLHAHMHTTYICTCACTCIHNIYIYIHSHMHACTNIHTCTHTYTHTASSNPSSTSVPIIAGVVVGVCALIGICIVLVLL